MVRVPTAENQVNIQGMPGQRFAAPLNQGGEIIAGAARRMGSALAGVAQDMDEVQYQVELAGAKQLDVEFSSFERETLYNPETGYMNQQGQNALNGRKSVEESLAKRRSEILAKANSPRQRMILEGILTERVNSSLTAVSRHAATEGKRYADDVGKARIISEQQTAIAARDNPEALTMALGTIEDEVDAWADRNGASPEMRDLERRSQLGRAHAGIIDTLATKDPEAAQGWLDKHRDQMPPTEADKIEDALKPAVMKAKAGRIADEVRGVAGLTVKNMARDDNLQTRLAAVDKMKLDPELAEVVKREVQQGVALDQQMLRDQRERAGEQAWAMVDEGRPVPPSLMAQLKRSDRESILSAVERRSGEAGGFAKRSNVDQLVAAENMAAMDPDAFAKINLNEMRDQFAQGDWMRLVREQREIRQGGAGKPTAERAIISATAETMRAAGLDLEGLKGNRRQAMSARIVAAREAIRSDVRAFEERHKRPPDTDEIQDMADRQLLKVQVWKDGMLGGSGEDALMFEARGKAKAVGGTVRYDTPDVAVPDAFRQQFEQKWRRRNNGRAPSEREIARAYLALGL